uniref:Ig-like domain-containing protein n=1 Tax=Takifugu rubripes TaxID=31033 RepID=A0A674MU63_TAKRU
GDLTLPTPLTLLFDPPEPTRIRMVVKEDSEVVLNCSASGNIRDQVFDWRKDDDVEVFLYSRGSTYGSGRSGQSPQFAGRVAHFPEALDLGNASIRIKKAEVRDSGIYTCTFPHSAPTQFDLTLVFTGACSEPNIRMVDGGPDRALLQCEVKGAHPRPAVQWQDSSGRVLPALETESEERDGRFYITVRANVSRSDDYSCVVTPKEACRQNEARTFELIRKLSLVLNSEMVKIHIFRGNEEKMKTKRKKRRRLVLFNSSLSFRVVHGRA